MISNTECRNITGITAKRFKRDAIKLNVILLVIKNERLGAWGIFCKNKCLSSGETPEKAIAALGYDVTNIRYIKASSKKQGFSKKKARIKKRRK